MIGEVAEDLALVKQAQAGDQDALAQLVERHQRKGYSVALRYVRNPADAADALQDAVVKVCSNLANFRGESSFNSWFLRIVSNACLDQIRRKQRNRWDSIDARAEREDRQIPSLAEAPEEQMLQKELRTDIRRAIRQLPEQYRVIVTLRDVMGYSYDRIAGMLGCPLHTVSSRLHRARQALRGALGVA